MKKLLDEVMNLFEVDFVPKGIPTYGSPNYGKIKKTSCKFGSNYKIFIFNIQV